MKATSGGLAMMRLSAVLIALILALSTPSHPDPDPDPQQFNPCNPKIQKCA